ncbi:hypothetical protein HY492_01115, partial [Candidatus Woesearchaeota archaeon]|nr:hypothetical protein [Candidatus Woesearchaeota archaeon]
MSDRFSERELQSLAGAREAEDVLGFDWADFGKKALSGVHTGGKVALSTFGLKDLGETLEETWASEGLLEDWAMSEERRRKQAEVRARESQIEPEVPQAPPIEAPLSNVPAGWFRTEKQDPRKTEAYQKARERILEARLKLPKALVEAPDYIVLVDRKGRGKVVSSPSSVTVFGGRRFDGNGYQPGNTRTFSFGYEKPAGGVDFVVKGRKRSVSGLSLALFLGGVEVSKSTVLGGWWDVIASVLSGGAYTALYKDVHGRRVFTADGSELTRSGRGSEPEFERAIVLNKPTRQDVKETDLYKDAERRSEAARRMARKAKLQRADAFKARQAAALAARSMISPISSPVSYSTPDLKIDFSTPFSVSDPLTLHFNFSRSDIMGMDFQVLGDEILRDLGEGGTDIDIISSGSDEDYLFGVDMLGALAKPPLAKTSSTRKKIGALSPSKQISQTLNKTTEKVPIKTARTTGKKSPHKLALVRASRA